MELDQIKLSIEAEQKMDNGELNFVVNNGLRMAVSKDVFEVLGLKNGQTINNLIAMAILKTELDDCRTKLAIQKAMDQN